MKSDKLSILHLIIVAGMFFTLCLQWQIPDEVFFSGDGGLKALLAKQFSTGDWRFDLHIPGGDWIKQLWHQGLYPFERPFVYQQGSDRYYITFPFTFPLMSAPFYKLFGFRGLYIIPLVSIWLLWWRFLVVCQRLKLTLNSTAIALTALIFASPLTLYSAMYWEHSLAVLLGFYGLSSWVEPEGWAGRRSIILGGLALGFAFWLRPEFICLMAALLTITILTGNLKFIGNQKTILFFGSMAIAASLFLLTNLLIYHHILGIHGLQILEKITIGDRVRSYLWNFHQIGTGLIKYFPLTILIAAYGGYNWLQKSSQIQLYLPKLTNWLFLIQVLYILYVPLILPKPETGGNGGKQWGPRFWLIIIVILCWVMAIAWQSLIENGSYQQRYLGKIAIISLLVAGIVINTLGGAIKLSTDYHQRVLPALVFIRQSPQKIIATSDAYINQELAALFNQKIFFLTNNGEKLRQLATAAAKQGYEQLLYVSTRPEPFERLELPLGSRRTILKNLPLGKFGSYYLFNYQF
jgi:hypothetical protein